MYKIMKKQFFFIIHKMYLISAERYKNAEVGFLKIRKTDKIWVIMKNVYHGLDAKNMSDLILKKKNMRKKTLQTMKLKNIK